MSLATDYREAVDSLASAYGTSPWQVCKSLAIEAKAEGKSITAQDFNNGLRTARTGERWDPGPKTSTRAAAEYAINFYLSDRKLNQVSQAVRGDNLGNVSRVARPKRTITAQKKEVKVVNAAPSTKEELKQQMKFTFFSEVANALTPVIEEWSSFVSGAFVREILQEENVPDDFIRKLLLISQEGNKS